MSKWQPAKYAPKGEIVIVYGPAGIRFAYKDEYSQWRNMMRAPCNTLPTHWMPLPEPPMDGRESGAEGSKPERQPGVSAEEKQA